MTDDALNGVAFYLPQFHPIPENDAWWGPGFTEWSNVVRTRPRFPDHYQPHLPADLGFYDLRVPEVRAAQAQLAREAGLSAFCYYHYWFNGRRLLERPFDEVRRTGEPDFPFFLMWANENWTRRWDGTREEVLLEQTYTPDDDLAHIRWLCDAMADPRYFRVEGRPVLVVYRPDDLPDAPRTIDTWRNEASRLGVGELYLCRVSRQRSELGAHEAQGFDAAIDWIPNFDELGLPLRWNRMWGLSRRLGLTSRGYGQNRVWEYADVAEANAAALTGRDAAGVHYPCVTVSWDNSARRPRTCRYCEGQRPICTRRGCGPRRARCCRDKRPADSSSSTRGMSGPKATTSNPASGGVARISTRPRASCGCLRRRDFCGSRSCCGCRASVRQPRNDLSVDPRCGARGCVR